MLQLARFLHIFATKITDKILFRMKKNVLLYTVVALWCIVTTAHAQEPGLTNRHEIRVGAGAVWHPEYGYSKDTHDYDPFPPGYAGEYYQGHLIGTPAINLSYNYQFKSWLSFGATLTYVWLQQKSYDLYTDAVSSKQNEHFIGLTPTIRLDWFRSSTVRLYSIAGFGIGFGTDKTTSYTSSERGYRENLSAPTVDLTPIGISVGRKIFGFCELGLSNLGLLKAGIGYRFNSK